MVSFGKILKRQFLKWSWKPCSGIWAGPFGKFPDKLKPLNVVLGDVTSVVFGFQSWTLVIVDNLFNNLVAFHFFVLIGSTFAIVKTCSRCAVNENI